MDVAAAKGFSVRSARRIDGLNGPGVSGLFLRGACGAGEAVVDSETLEEGELSRCVGACAGVVHVVAARRGDAFGEMDMRVDALFAQYLLVVWLVVWIVVLGVPTRKRLQSIFDSDVAL